MQKIIIKNSLSFNPSYWRVLWYPIKVKDTKECVDLDCKGAK